MADRPILFSAPMVRALLAGTKTQTRRVIKPQPPEGFVRHCWYDAPLYGFTRPQNASGEWHTVRLLAYKGDILWVRETWSGNHHFREVPPSRRESFNTPDGPSLREDVWFWADGNPTGGDYEKPRPGIHMPRWASRLTLTVTDVRVERLQDCSEADAIAEGIERHKSGWMPYSTAFYDGDGITPANYHADPRISYMQLWDRINGRGAWDANPWVAAYTFTVHHGNIDQIGRAA